MRKRDIISYFKISILESLKILLLFFFASGYAVTPIEEDIIPYSESKSDLISKQIYPSTDSLRPKENISVSNTEKVSVFMTQDGLIYDPEHQMMANLVVIEHKKLSKTKIKNSIASKPLAKQVRSQNISYPKQGKKSQVFINPYSEKQLFESTALLNYKCASIGGQNFSLSLPEIPQIPGRSFFYFEKEFLNGVYPILPFLNGNRLFCRPPPLA